MYFPIKTITIFLGLKLASVLHWVDTTVKPIFEKVVNFSYSDFFLQTEVLVGFISILVFVDMARYCLHRWKTSGNPKDSSDLKNPERESLEEELSLYKERENTYKDYYRCKKNKTNAVLRLKIYKKKKEIENLTSQISELETELKHAEVMLGERESGHSLMETIRSILISPDYNETKVSRNGKILYDDDNEWTLTKLKERAKQLGIPFLSKYRWSTRKSLASTIRTSEQLERIAKLVGIEFEYVDLSKLENEQYRNYI